MELADFVLNFAAALTTVDALRPVFTSRTGRVYQPGIGPHSEDRAVDLILAEMRTAAPQAYGSLVCRVAYEASRESCDVGLAGEWVLEVKMAGVCGDEAKPDDTSLKALRSPSHLDRSALTVCATLAAPAG